MPDRDPVLAYVGLGANLGSPRESFDRAIEAIAALEGTRLIARSSIYKSAPVDAAGPDYTNAVAGFATLLTAPALLDCLLRIETELGRTRPFFHAPRTIDLDLLLFGDGHVFSQNLIVPHPRMYERAFVLLPLAEIAPERVSAGQLAAVSGQRVERWTSGG